MLAVCSSPPPVTAPRLRAWLLGGLLAISEAGYVALSLLHATNGVRPVVAFLSWMTVLFASYLGAFLVLRHPEHGQRASLTLLLVGAVLFRVTLLPAGLAHVDSVASFQQAARDDLHGTSVTYNQFLLFDSDIWRYLWEGHMGAHGRNPFQTPPESPALDALAGGNDPTLTDGRAVWDDIRSNVNHPWLPTVYPPLLQAVFRLSHGIAPGSVLALKALLSGFDLLTILLVALTLRRLGRPVEWVVLYAWNPLVIKVIAGSGHADGIVGLTLVLCAYLLVRGGKSAAALSFGLAILAKLTPIALLPFLVRRVGLWRTGLTLLVVIVCCLPFVDGSPAMFAGYHAFARTWTFNAGWFSLISLLVNHLGASRPEVIARLLTALTYLLVLGWLVRRDDGRPESFAAVGATALALEIIMSPTVMPWYLMWVLPLAALARATEWLTFSYLVCAAFLVMVRGVEHPWAISLEYVAFLLVWGAKVWRRRPRRAAIGLGPTVTSHTILHPGDSL